MQKKDISNRKDIEQLVNSFYDDVKKDETIGWIFQEIIGEDWSQHLPIMYQFWETVLFGVASYRGNPVQKHVQLDKKTPLQNEHYQRWLSLWMNKIDELFEGTIANKAKDKAGTMLQLIKMKVEASRSGTSIL